MSNNKNTKIAALVTARGKNTLRNKHLILVNKKPLIWYPVSIAKKCRSFDHYYISSDNRKILKIGEKEGYQIIKRPKKISLPTSMHIDAIVQALDIMKSKDNYTPDILVVLLGNTVYFKPEWIENSIKLLLEDENISAVVPIYRQNDHHPYRAKFIDNHGFLRPYFDFSKRKISTNRQNLRSNYFLCHNFWTLRVSKSIKGKNGQAPWIFMGKNIRPLILEGGPDVHEAKDIGLCECWLNNNKNK